MFDFWDFVNKYDVVVTINIIVSKAFPVLSLSKHRMRLLSARSFALCVASVLNGVLASDSWLSFRFRDRPPATCCRADSLKVAVVRAERKLIDVVAI
jgi:hypothetical protein